jgi:hypothetical protein
VKGKRARGLPLWLVLLLVALGVFVTWLLGVR